MTSKNKIIKKVPVPELKAGDKVELEAGDVVKISSITKGWLGNSKFLNYSNGGWSCLFNSDKVEVIGYQR